MTTGDEREYPSETQQKLEHFMRGAPVDRHVEVVFGDLYMGGEPWTDFVEGCYRDSATVSHQLKVFRSPLALYYLCRYFLYSMDVEGAKAECGVFRGTSALAMCRAAKSENEGYDGTGLHLVDSFEGISAPGMQDRFAVRPAHPGAPAFKVIHENSLASSMESCRKALKEFPGVALHKGWIPEAFAALPETRWSFVHIDVDVYQPTLATLEYFHPRMSPGGFIICDDYSAPFFPGASRAWDEFCGRNGIPFVVLPTGQSVIAT